MKIIENSNIVNWDEHPNYICALVMQAMADFRTAEGLVCPKGKELIWLLDKAPKLLGEEIKVEYANIHCVDDILPFGIISGYFPVDVKEIHFKPKPTTKYICHTESGEPSQA